MTHRVYIDGHVGTTGLRIRDWLAGREDLEVLTLPETDRKNPDARREALRQAEVAVLCLPDDAARDAAAWAEGSAVRLLDASTAHRVDDAWVYGLPELTPDQRKAIRDAPRVSNPGCYASAFILATRPLVDAGLVEPNATLGCHGLSGYSGGGRPMIEKWEDPAQKLASLPFSAPYALNHVHKHVAEMMHWTGLGAEPQMLPAVGPFRCGMRVAVPLHAGMLRNGANGKDVWEILEARYQGEPFVRLQPLAEGEETHEHSFDPCACNDTNRIELHVRPHPSGHVLLLAILDNLGKGAAGVAIQSLNLMLGCEETAGLRT